MPGVTRGGRGGHPRGIGAGLRMCDLGFEHVRHEIGHGPHALADLRAAAQAAGKADIHVLAFIGVQPHGLLEFSLLRGTAAASIEGMNLIAGAVEEAGVDGENATRCRAAQASRIQPD